MNVIPYIDVMLVLLLVFMIAAPLMYQGLEVNLPETTSKEINLNDFKEPLIIDVNENAVKKLFINNHYAPLMIHGHTHRLKTHDYNFDGHQCQRWVLGDWDKEANYLIWDGKKLQNKFFNLN